MQQCCPYGSERGASGQPASLPRLGNTETMKLTRTEPVGWTGRTTRELRRSARQKKQRDCTTVGVCAKGIKTKAKNS
jgi:hypothetical protein